MTAKCLLKPNPINMQFGHLGNNFMAIVEMKKAVRFADLTKS